VGPGEGAWEPGKLESQRSEQPAHIRLGGMILLVLHAPVGPPICADMCGSAGPLDLGPARLADSQRVPAREI